MRNLQGSLENTEDAMKKICAVDTGNDFITIEVVGTEQISVEKKYPGIKTHFIGRISNVRIPFSIDVGIDDVVVPNPIKREILTRLPDFQAPKVYTYSLESTIAEKLDAILQRMSGTSRMKDFYDIYYLSGIFDFDVLEVISERTPEMDMELARAYNNLADPDVPEGKRLLHRALDLMQLHEEEFAETHSWNFRMGYAYYHLDQDGRALQYFEKALKLHPGDDPKINTKAEIEALIDHCKANVALPDFRKTECFRKRNYAR